MCWVGTRRAGHGGGPGEGRPRPGMAGRGPAALGPTFGAVVTERQREPLSSEDGTWRDSTGYW